MKTFLSETDIIEKTIDEKASVTLTYDNSLSTGFVCNDVTKTYFRTINNINLDTFYFEGIITTATLTVSSMKQLMQVAREFY